MIDYLRFDEWDHTPGEPHSIEVRVIGGKIQTNNPAWRIIDKDNYEKDWEDYQGDSSKWLKEFDDLSVDLWKDYYDEFGIKDGSQWDLTYRSEGREHEKSGSLDWPENWSAFHELIEQLGFDDGVFDLCPVHIHELHVVMKESRVISYEEALDIAKSTDSGFNHCLEYEKAWFFWNTANDMSEGPVPYAVFKESGFAKWFGAYDQVNQSAGEFLKEFDIN